MLIDEGDMSNYHEVNINENLDGTFKLSQSHLVKKKYNHVGLEASTGLKARETPSGKLLLHKEKSSIGKKCVWNYISVVGILIYLQGSLQPEISMAVH